jgi:co-chaperonin GroES (HSP10)
MVVVKVEYAFKSKSIIIPETAKRDSGEYWGEVVSVGPEYPDKSLKAGDKIIFDRNEGYKIRPYYGDWKEEFYAVKQRWCGVKI